MKKILILFSFLISFYSYSQIPPDIHPGGVYIYNTPISVATDTVITLDENGLMRKVSLDSLNVLSDFPRDSIIMQDSKSLGDIRKYWMGTKDSFYTEIASDPNFTSKRLLFITDSIPASSGGTGGSTTVVDGFGSTSTTDASSINNATVLNNNYISLNAAIISLKNAIKISTVSTNDEVANDYSNLITKVGTNDYAFIKKIDGGFRMIANTTEDLYKSLESKSYSLFGSGISAGNINSEFTLETTVGDYEVYTLTSSDLTSAQSIIDGAYGSMGLYLRPENYEGSGAGDMLKSTYDTDDDDIVDNSERVGGLLPAQFLRAEVTEHKEAGDLIFNNTVGLSFGNSSNVRFHFNGTNLVTNEYTNPILFDGDAQFESVILEGGTSDDVLLGDGTTTSLAGIGGGGGATNLSYNAGTQTVASDTGTDAVIPLADDTNAGLLPFYETDIPFVPTLVDVGGGATYSATLTSTYSRIGNIVTFSIQALNINTTGTPTGVFEIHGLPYSVSSFASCPVALISGSSVNFYSILGKCSSDNIGFAIQANLDGTINVSLQDVTFTSGLIQVSGTYTTND